MFWRRISSPGCLGVMIPYNLIRIQQIYSTATHMKTKHQSVQRASNMLWRKTSNPGCHGVILPYALTGTIADQPEHQVLLSAPSLVLRASSAEPPGSCVVTAPTKLCIFTSPVIIRVIKSFRMRCMRHVACIGRRKIDTLFWKPEGKRSLGRPTYTWEDTFKINLKEIGCENVEWINLSEHRVQWWIAVNMVMKLWAPDKAENLLTS
jgi:hypothetical protein